MTGSSPTPPAWPDIAPSRFAAGIERGAWPPTPAAAGRSAFTPTIALLGLPDDLGVRLNHGRTGAALGPTAFRAALARYGATDCLALPVRASTEGGQRGGLRVVDFGDVHPAPGDDADALHETHRRVSAAAHAIAAAGHLPTAIGGGHDLTFAFVSGVLQAHGSRRPPTDQRGDSPKQRSHTAPTNAAGVYFDAHLDVRAEAGSGMPFRALVEQCGVVSLTVCGLDEWAATREHLAWFRDHGGARHDGPPESFLWPSAPTFVSLDLDVIDQAYAPGVSAMNPCGWTPELAARWCRAAGSNPRTICFDIMELSPPHDDALGSEAAGRVRRTARLAARLWLEFISGVAERR